MKKTAVILLTAIILALCSCAKTGNYDTTTAPYKYNADAASTTAAPVESTSAYAPTGVDESWKGNYSLTYVYIRSGESSTLSELRCADRFMSSDKASGISSYFIVNGNDIDKYVVYPSDGKATHELLKDKSLSNLSSGFMKISKVDEGFKSLENVAYMGSETVDGRACEKYIQKSYENGEETATATVWIDSQYGFVVRLESVDANGEQTLSWELMSFSVGTVTSSDIVPALDGLEIIEEAEDATEY
ncbi:MAG: hypothetical protein K6C36_10480 [Clostridia bacterium]|nr:hypothetical protein [Clostridia bacterium]